MFVRLGDDTRFYRMLHPSLTVVITSRCPNGRVNLMPASWNMPVSEEPPSIAVAIDREAYTYECLRHHGEATINIPHHGLADVVYALGSVSGRDVDKVERLGIRLEPSETVDVPRWSDAIGVYEVEVWRRVDVGEVSLHIFRVKAAYAKEGLLSRWGWDLSKTNVLLHGAGRTFYLAGRVVRARRLEL